MTDSTASPHHIVLIDGYGFVFRAYHAVPPLTREDGIQVGAVYGFTSMLMKILSDIKATHIAVIFDAGKKTFRNDLYPEYKAHRPPAPDDLIPQFAIVREAAKALNLFMIEKEGYEADDIIATIARMGINEGDKITIVSADKDLMQLIDSSVSMFDPMKSKMIREQEVVEKFGVMPDKVTDVLAIIGDSSDNIPGIPGIGPKGAAELISQFNSLEELYERTHEIKQNRRRDLVETNKEIALLSKRLVTLCDKVPFDFKFSDMIAKPVELNILVEFLKIQNFKSLITRAQNQFAKTNKTAKEQASEKARSYSSMTDLSELSEFCNAAKKTGFVSVFFVTEKKENLPKTLAISFSTGKETIFIPIKFEQQISLIANTSPSFALDDVFEIVKEIIEDKSVVKVFYDYKNFLHTYCVKPVSVDDISPMSYSLNSTSVSCEFDDIITHYLNLKLTSINELKGSGRNKLSLDQVESQKLVDYASARAECILKVYHILKQDIFKEKINTLYQKIEKPLALILYKMEKEGIKIDKEKLKLMSADFANRISCLEKEIHQITGEEFNVASPKQLAEVLFEKMQLPHKKASKSGNYSTGADILEDLAENGHKVAEVILHWRSLSKLKNTYTDSLIAQAKDDDRVHTSFLMASTSTGRLSSVEPNLQNIPIRSEEGNKIRECFISKPGYKLLSADYSQIELRVLAHIADISSLKEAFAKGLDVHSATASQIFNVPHDQVDSNMRRKAKAINFGIIYGISSFGLAKQLSISRIEASNYIKAYFNTYPGIEKFMEETKEFARKNGYVETLYRRKCFVKGINDSNQNIRAIAERAAINAPIQGTAADIIKAAMIKLDQIFTEKNSSAKMLLQVHDELLFEVADSKAEIVAAIVKKEMENIINLSVNFIVDIGIGNNWAEI